MTNVDLSCVVPIADLAVHWDEERSQQMFEHIIEDGTDGHPEGAVHADRPAEERHRVTGA